MSKRTILTLSFPDEAGEVLDKFKEIARLMQKSQSELVLSFIKAFVEEKDQQVLTV